MGYKWEWAILGLSHFVRVDLDRRWCWLLYIYIIMSVVSTACGTTTTPDPFIKYYMLSCKRFRLVCLHLFHVKICIFTKNIAHIFYRSFSLRPCKFDSIQLIRFEAIQAMFKVDYPSMWKWSSQFNSDVKLF